MANLKITAAQASKKAAEVNNEKAKKRKEMVDQAVQNCLDLITEEIEKVSLEGGFKLELGYKNDKNGLFTKMEDNKFIVNEEIVLNEAISILREGGFTASIYINNSGGTRSIKIEWEDPEDDSTK